MRFCCLIVNLRACCKASGGATVRDRSPDSRPVAVFLISVNKHRIHFGRDLSLPNRHWSNARQNVSVPTIPKSSGESGCMHCLNLWASRILEDNRKRSYLRGEWVKGICVV